MTSTSMIKLLIMLECANQEKHVNILPLTLTQFTELSLDLVMLRVDEK